MLVPVTARFLARAYGGDIRLLLQITHPNTTVP